MKCEPFAVGEGPARVTGFICGARSHRKTKQCACGRTATLECDHPHPKRKSGTCDAPICDTCVRKVGTLDHCRAHDAPPGPRDGATVPLVVQSARLGYRGADWLDVSLQGNERRVAAGEVGGHLGIGMTFAPSPRLLYEFLSKRKWQRLTPEDWPRYREAYTTEMRASFRRYRVLSDSPWHRLMAMPRVVLLCFCTDGNECHRAVLGGILEKLGATYAGEIGSVVDP